MPPYKVLEHSPGMISVDADASRSDKKTLDAITQTALFKSVEKRIGRDRALEVLTAPRTGTTAETKTDRR